MGRRGSGDSYIRALISVYLLGDALKNSVIAIIDVLSPIVFAEIFCAAFAISLQEELSKAAIKVPEVGDETVGAASIALVELPKQALSGEARGFLDSIAQRVSDECKYIMGVWRETAANLWKDMNLDDFGGLTKNGLLLNVFESEVAKACLKEQSNVASRAALFVYRTLMTLSLTVATVARHHNVQLATELGKVFAKLCLAASVASTPERQKGLDKAMSAFKVLGGPLYLVYRAYQVTYKGTKIIKKIGTNFATGFQYGIARALLREPGGEVPKFDKALFENAVDRASRSTDYTGVSPKKFLESKATDDESARIALQVVGQNSENQIALLASQIARKYEWLMKAVNLSAGALGFYAGNLLSTMVFVSAVNMVANGWESTRVRRA